MKGFHWTFGRDENNSYGVHIWSMELEELLRGIQEMHENSERRAKILEKSLETSTSPEVFLTPSWDPEEV